MAFQRAFLLKYILNSTITHSRSTPWGAPAVCIKQKVLLHDENDETPRKNDLSALILCNPPALESYPKVVARHWIMKLISVSRLI